MLLNFLTLGFLSLKEPTTVTPDAPSYASLYADAHAVLAQAQSAAAPTRPVDTAWDVLSRNAIALVSALVPHVEAQQEPWALTHALPLAQTSAQFAELSRAVSSRQHADLVAQKRTLDGAQAVVVCADQYLHAREAAASSPPPSADALMAAVQSLLRDLKQWFEQQKRKQNEVDFATRVISDALKRRSQQPPSTSTNADLTLEKAATKGGNLASQVSQATRQTLTYTHTITMA